MDRTNANIPDVGFDLSPFYKSFMEHTSDMVFFKTPDLVYVAASNAFAKMVGKQSADEIIGHTDLEIFADKHLALRYIDDDRKLIDTNTDFSDYTEPLASDPGMPRYGRTSKYLVRDNDGKLLGLLGITRDVTLDYITQQHYQQELSYLFELPEDAYAAVLIDVDDWRVVMQQRNHIGGATMQHCHTINQMLEAALESIIDITCPASRFYQEFNPEVLRKRYYEKGESFFSFQYERRLSDGSVRWVLNEIRFLVDPASRHLGVILTALDIDERKREELDVYMAAKMDRMTMVLNRETTTSLIKNVLVNEADNIHVLFMLDLDNFKNLNDRMGHQTGDEFLVRMATKLKSCFRESDIIGRIGGDEFFVLMRNLPNLIVAKNKARQLLNVFRDLCSEYTDIELSCSIGASAYPENGVTLDELYAKADDALYSAKHRGKNCCVSAF